MKKKSKKEAQNLADREMTDYNEFLQDIEEDPEMRANINLYQDKDVIQSLEEQLGSLSLTAGTSNTKSPGDAALASGSATVGGTTRKVVKAKRTTETAQEALKKSEALRKKDTDLFKASMKNKK